MKHWRDFIACVEKSGYFYEMKVGDFKSYEHGLSQSQDSRNTRPLLDNVSVAEFRTQRFYLFVL